MVKNYDSISALIVDQLVDQIKEYNKKVNTYLTLESEEDKPIAIDRDIERHNSI